eukprot:3655270-Lingulodinium_polyedra.AAC.1
MPAFTSGARPFAVLEAPGTQGMVLISKSVGAMISYVRSGVPFMSCPERHLSLVQVSSWVASSSSHVKSSDKSPHVGTQNAIPVSLPLTCGTALSTALAASAEQ